VGFQNISETVKKEKLKQFIEIFCEVRKQSTWLNLETFNNAS